MNKRKALLYFSNSRSLSTIGFDTDFFDLDETCIFEKYGTKATGEIYLVFDELGLSRFEKDIWEHINGDAIDAFGFVHHRKPSEEVKSFLSYKKNHLHHFEGKNDPNIPDKAKYYTEIRDIVNGNNNLTSVLFESLWKKYERGSASETNLALDYNAWLDELQSNPPGKYIFPEGKVIYVDSLSQQEKIIFNKAGIMVASPEQIISRVQGKQLKDDTSLAVLCELAKDHEENTIKHTDFFGIKLVQKLRRRKYRGKVLFVTSSDKVSLIKRSPKHKIINTIGHSVLKLPAALSEWQKELASIAKLSNVEWHDVVSNYCTTSGLAQLELHYLRGIVNDACFSSGFVKERIIECIQKIGKLCSYPVSGFIEDLNFNDHTAVIQAVENFCGKIISEYEILKDKAVGKAITEEKKKKPWSILFLDDEINNAHKLVAGLEKKVRAVFCVSDAESARTLIENDKKNGNQIALVISDYRLEDNIDGITIHQKTQGYKFLMKTSEDCPYIALSALSALPRKFLLQSFKSMGIKVDVYSKKDYFESPFTLKILIDDLIDKGDEAFEAIIRLPRISSPKWEFFEPFYAYHRKSIHYASNELYISNKAKNYCLEYAKGNILFDLKAYTTELKGKTKIPSNQIAFDEFLEKMVCRRAVLWFSRKYTMDIHEIHEFLLGSTLKAYRKEQENKHNEYLKGWKTKKNTGKPYSLEERLKNNAKNQIHTNLAMRLTEFPWNTTIEERNWLIYEMEYSQKAMEKIEKQELELLGFSEKKILRLPVKLPYVPNTFLRCKYWLRKNAFAEENDNPTLELLIKKVTIIKAKIQHLSPDFDKLSKSSKAFFHYLDRLVKYLKKLKAAKKAGPLPDNLEEIKEKVVAKAKKEYKSKELLEGIEGSALIFFDDLKREEKYYTNFNAYYQAFIKDHKKKTGGLDPNQFILEDSFFDFRDDTSQDFIY